MRLLPLALLVSAGGLPAQVAGIEVTERELVLEGKSFGSSGAYERLSGRLFFALDPGDPRNARIVDLELAPKNAEGRVEAWTEFLVLQPADPERRRGTALVEVSNRGGKASLSYFNRARGSSDPRLEAEFGDGLLMRLGLTVVWLGWQWDVPEQPGRLRLHVPVARAADGSALEGLVRCDWVVDQPTEALRLGNRNHIAYLPVPGSEAEAVLTARNGREAERLEVERGTWRFAGLPEDRSRSAASGATIERDGGFTAGSIYELVYRARDPRVVGMGFAAIRDVVAYAKHDPDCPFPVERGIAIGISQTGRFLRHFVYQGFQTDTEGRPAYDGLLVLTAGAGRGSFNHRFAQPSFDAHRYSAFFFPTDLFPFHGRLQEDPLTGRIDGLFAHQHDPEHLPRTFWINTGYEYWGRAAALVHTRIDGAGDLPLTGRERVYHIAASQHFPGGTPRWPGGEVESAPALRGNGIDLRAVYRALLVRMVEWLEGGLPAPLSRMPRIADGGLTAVPDVAWPAIPGLRTPTEAHVAYRVDYGPEWSAGRITMEPPDVGAAFAARVPQVDADGLEIGGLRALEVRVPLATLLPWQLRTGELGSPHELRDFVGTTVPFARDRAQAQEWGDPRPSLLERYGDRDGFARALEDAAEALTREGFLLDEDRRRAVERQLAAWDRRFAVR